MRLSKSFGVSVAFLFVALVALFAPPEACAQDKPPSFGGVVAFAPNKTVPVRLKPGETLFFYGERKAGSYQVVLDGETQSGKNVRATLAAQVRGAERTGKFILRLDLKESGREGRAGVGFTLPHKTGVRFRLTNTGAAQSVFYLTARPAADKAFVPFGFGAKVQNAVVDAEKESVGTLTKGQYAYYRVTLPPGVWNVSVGAKSSGRASVRVAFLSEQGLPRKSEVAPFPVHADNAKGRALEERILRPAKPQTLLIRLWNEGAFDDTPATYSLTVYKEP